MQCIEDNLILTVEKETREEIAARGAYLIEPSIENRTASLGVINKVLSQIQVFQKAGIEMVEYVYTNDLSIKGKLLRRLPFTNELPKWDYSYNFKNINFVYFRKPISMNFAFRKYLRWIKKQNPRIKIVMEIPTYPYDGELLADKKDFPLYIYDKIGRHYLRGKIDRIAAINKECDLIYHVPVIHFRNGADFSKIRLHSHKLTDNRIDLCCVANFTFWHGYDRLINGLCKYYENGGKTHIFLHMVGEGTELDYLMKITKEKELAGNVIFYGKKDRDGVFPIYDMCDIGVGSLGMHRGGFSYAYSLKSKEYMGAGLPIIEGCPSDISDTPELNEFVCAFPNDDSDIDINVIIDFYEGLINKFGGQINDMSKKIRDSIKRNFNMDSAMSEVIGYVLSEE